MLLMYSSSDVWSSDLPRVRNSAHASMESRCTVIQKASPSSPKYLRRLGSILALSSALGACTLPDAQKLPLRGDLAQKQTERFNQEAGPAVEVISVPEIGRASCRERGCQSG